MDLAAVLTLDVLNGVASLILLCTGLAVIFGMMKIINLAHGEFLMLGAYATVVAVEAGINIWIAMLVVSPVFVGLVGLVVERTFIRLLYGRLVDSMLATWGLSLFLVGLITTIFGNTIKSVPSPLGGFTIGAYRSSLYTVFLVAVAITLLGGLWLLMRRTRFGLIARATMQNPDMAAAMGVSPPGSIWRPSASAPRSPVWPAGCWRRWRACCRPWAPPISPRPSSPWWRAAPRSSPAAPLPRACSASSTRPHRI